MKTWSSFLRSAAAVSLLVLAACQDLSVPVAGPEEGGVEPATLQAPRAPSLHSPQQVAGWFARSAPEVLSLPMTVFAAHDQAENRVVFGVENAAAMRGVQTALERLGVPSSGYTLRVTDPIRFASTTLRTEHRPTKGGIQINFGNYVCTLGFNIDHAGGRSFVTNSHCTNQQGTTGSTTYYQPVASTSPSPIAVEAHDPSYTRLPGCSRGKTCRYSDAARALYDAGTASSPGVIAKTDGVNNGSLNVAGSFTITSQDNSSTSFSGTLHKVGRTTGWSSGNVTSTCATVNVSGSSLQLLCQTIVENPGAVIVQGGDSGSPVFRITSGDDVQLAGILWGGNTSGSLFVFSPLKQIQDELGSMVATSDGAGGGGGDGGGDGGGGGGEDPAPCVPRGPSGNNCK
jgi:hypothetical protein